MPMRRKRVMVAFAFGVFSGSPGYPAVVVETPGGGVCAAPVVVGSVRAAAEAAAPLRGDEGRVGRPGLSDS